MVQWVCRDWSSLIQSFFANFGITLDLFIVQLAVSMLFFFAIGFFIRSMFRSSEQAVGTVEGNFLIFGSAAAAILFVKQVCG